MNDAGQHRLWSIPGDGVLAREGNLVLLSSIDDRGFAQSLLDLLARTSQARGDGRALADAIGAAIESHGSWGGLQTGPAVLAFGPAGEGLAFAVSGTAFVEISTSHGTHRLVAGHPSMLLRSVVAVAIRAVRGGLGGNGPGDRTDRFTRLDSGTVRAWGLSYQLDQPGPAAAAFPAAAPAQPAPAGAHAAPAAPAPGAVTPAQPAPAAPAAPPGPAAPPAPMAPAAGPAAQAPPGPPADLPPAATPPAAPPSFQFRPADGPAAGAPADVPPEVTPQAPVPPGPGEWNAEPAPGQFQAGPFQQERYQPEPFQPGPPQGGPYLAEPPPFAAGPGYDAPGPPPAQGDQVAQALAEHGLWDPSRRGPGEAAPPREPDGGAAAYDLGLEPGIEAPPPAPMTSLGPAARPGTAEQPVTDDTEDTAAEAADEDGGGAPIVVGVYCKHGHFSDPDERSCGVCGTGISRRSAVPERGPRPTLGVLLLDDGATVEVDGDYVIGRDPMREPTVAAGEARPLRIVDAESTVSRVHARVHLDGWKVLLTDLGSANGTQIQPPGAKAQQPLEPRNPVPIQHGTRIVVGAAGLRYERPSAR